MNNNTFSKTLFPSKQKILDKLPTEFKPKMVLSNHFQVEILQESVSVNEWEVKIFLRENSEGDDQIEIFKQNPKLVKNEIEADARKLINSHYFQVLKQVKQKLGNFVFFSGFQLYQLVKDKLKYKFEESYYFESFENYVFSLTLVNTGISQQQLVANQNQRLPFLRFLNIAMKNILKQHQLYEYGKTKEFYDIKNYQEIKDLNLEVYQGMFSTFEIYEGKPKNDSGLRLLADISTRIVQSDNLWQMFLKKFKSYDSVLKIPKSQVEEFFIGINVITIYGNNFNRYRIDGVDFKTQATDPFPNKQFKSYFDYYLQKYKCSIQHKKQFLLKSVQIQNVNGVKNKVTVLLVPELLKMTGMTEQQKIEALPLVSKYTIKDPYIRFTEIGNSIEKQLNKIVKDPLNPQKIAQNDIFKISLQNNQVKGFQLPKPILQFSKKTLQMKSSKISYEQFYKKKDFDNWYLIYDVKYKQNIEEFLQQFYKAGDGLKITIKKPTILPLVPQNSPHFSTKEKIKAFIESFHKEEEIGEPGCIVLLISESLAQKLYNPFKKFYSSQGIATQVISSFDPKKDLQKLSKFSNIIIQMMNKMGGRAHLIHQNVKDTMVLGIEFSIANLVNQRRGVLCVQAQYGENLEKFYQTCASYKIEDLKKNKIQNIDTLILDCVKNYQKKLKKQPKNIIIYRQGLSQQQIDQIILQEVGPIREILKKEFPSNTPKVNFIIVNKKIKDKFVEIETKKNLEGVVIESEVTIGDRANFYMIPQYVTRGTATPTHYQIILNESEDILFYNTIQLTYNLTFDYQNWAGPIRVPSIIQNSEKLAKLCIQLQQTKIHKNNKDKLFYL